MQNLYDQVTLECSKITTRRYSTSFTLGIRLLGKEVRDPVFSIYGFVRFADEIVDTFHQYDKSALIEKFKHDTFEAIESGISLNPILHSFQKTVNQYRIDHGLIETFLKSMEMDLDQQDFDRTRFLEYILGSAEVVGLMCLSIFTRGNEESYQKLKPFAMALGAAFQKVNFLRDIKKDYHELGRTYFPQMENHEFTYEIKALIESEIQKDFDMALNGIKQLPSNSKFGVYLAYVYYYALFRRIKNTPPARIIEARIRIPNPIKYFILFYSYIKYRLNLI